MEGIKWKIILILIVAMVNGEEPKIERFGYETQLLEKLIRMEIKEERMESERQTSKQQLEESLQEFRKERETLIQDYKTWKATMTSDIRELKDEVKLATDGGWSAWSNWTDCTVTCLGGLTRRSRTCNNPEPTRFGRACVGHDEEVDSCNSVMCPDTDDCIGHSCKNGGTCIDGAYKYTCSCATGYTGEYCSTDIDECACSTCQNGATCVDGVAKYTCVCPTGYTGEFCQSRIDGCRKVANENGINKIFPSTAPQPFAVFCDQITDGGGWIVFQRRKDGFVDFERNWADYKSGFGYLDGEFWLGNDNIHVLTAAGFNELRVDLEDFDGNRAYAKYSNFDVKSETDNYTLTVSGYNGNAGDSMTYHSGMQFSTKDRDNDDDSSRVCSSDYRGAWWYKSCHYSNLNGFYYHGAGSPNAKGVTWHHWKGQSYSLKFVEMKIK